VKPCACLFFEWVPGNLPQMCACGDGEAVHEGRLGPCKAHHTPQSFEAKMTPFRRKEAK
jgi:hypothetical protein